MELTENDKKKIKAFEDIIKALDGVPLFIADGVIEKIKRVIHQDTVVNAESLLRSESLTKKIPPFEL